MRDDSFKRLLSAVLACAMLAGNLPAISRAEAPTQSEKTEIIQQENVMETENVVGDAPATLAASSGTCGTNLTWTLANGILTISGSGRMNNYSAMMGIGPSWDSIRDSITDVVIESGVTSIGSYAFDGYSSLTSVTIPSSVTAIGERAFAWCDSLATVNYSGTQAQWDAIEIASGNEIFAYIRNGSLSGICGESATWILKNGALTISGSGNMANYGLGGAPWDSIRDAITIVTIESGITSIGEAAFSSCRNLPSIIIPEGVTSIGSDAFSRCTSLPSIIIPEGVTSIGSDAFSWCTSLTSITIPSSVTSIGDHAFKRCSSLTTVNYNGTQEQWDAINIADGNSYLTLATEGSFSGTCGESATWILKNGTLTISGNGAMTNYTEGNAPWSSVLDSITIVVIESGITSIGSVAFSDCISLTTVTIPASVISIGSYAFYYCDSLTSVTIPESVTSIGSYAFDGCYNLTSVNYSGTQAQWDAIEIGDGNEWMVYIKNGIGTCGENVTWTLDDNGTLLISGNGAMTDYSWDSAPWYLVVSSITSVVIGSGVTSIGSYAFYDCSSLTSITIPVSVTYIGGYAFRSCRCLTTVNYGGTRNQWDTIVIDAGNSDLTNAQLVCEYDQSFACGGNITAYYKDGKLLISGTGDMWDYTGSGDLPWDSIRDSITGVVIESGVTSIGSVAFDGCSNLTSVTIPEGVTSIGSGAFSFCGMTSVIIPSSVTSIGIGAFAVCGSLTSVTIPERVTSIGRCAFLGCSLTTVNYSGTQEQWDAIEIASGNEILAYIRNGSLSGTCGESATWILKNGTLTISGTGAMLNYSWDSTAPWYYVGESITSVVIESGITSIGQSAFEYASNLTAVEIAADVTAIGDYAFFGCHALQTVNYGGTAAQWGIISICAGNEHLTGANITCRDAAARPTDIQMKLPGFLTTVEAEAFMGNTAMTAVEIPATVTAIESGAFKNCTGLTTVVFNGTAPIIAPDAFAGVTATVYYPEGNTSWTEDVRQSYGGNLTWEAYTG